MKEITTVTGNVAAEKLGFCQFHEHLAMRVGTYTAMNSALCIDDFDKSLQEVIDYKSAGGQSFVEAQPVGCGRDAVWLHEISELSGVNIIASTGFHKLGFYPGYHWIHSASEEDFQKLLMKELTEGMYTDGDHASWPSIQTPYKAGIIKTALDKEGLTRRYQLLFRAAASSARKTGISIMIHVEGGADPERLQNFLIDQGIAAERLVFCHLDRACQDMGVHKRILSKGSWLEYDTVGRFKYHSDQIEIEKISELIKSGYEDQLLYSLDTTRERLKAYNPSGVGLTYILRTFNKELESFGVKPSIIRKFSIDNPARAL